MVKASALALLAAMAVTNVAQTHRPPPVAPVVSYASLDSADARMTGAETLAVYYKPLAATGLASYAGFGTAYHMALVYTDRSGKSYGVSAVPSNLRSPQTPGNLFGALLAMANERPSNFGTLIPDRRNNRGFVKGSAADIYTLGDDGRPLQYALLRRSGNLSAQWASIVRAYVRLGAAGFTYSPMTQNSNSMAGAALRQAGIGVEFSSSTYFTPGLFTPLPLRNDTLTTGEAGS